MFYMIKVKDTYFPRLFYSIEEADRFGANMSYRELSYSEKEFHDIYLHELFEVVRVNITVEEVKSHEIL